MRYGNDVDGDQSGCIVLNDPKRPTRVDESDAKNAAEEVARQVCAADKSLRLRGEFNLARYMF